MGESWDTYLQWPSASTAYQAWSDQFLCWCPLVAYVSYLRLWPILASRQRQRLRLDRLQQLRRQKWWAHHSLPHWNHLVVVIYQSKPIDVTLPWDQKWKHSTIGGKGGKTLDLLRRQKDMINNVLQLCHIGRNQSKYMDILEVRMWSRECDVIRLRMPSKVG